MSKDSQPQINPKINQRLLSPIGASELTQLTFSRSSYRHGWQNYIMLSGVIVGVILIGINVSHAPSQKSAENSPSSVITTTTSSSHPSPSIQSKLLARNFLREQYSLVNQRQYQKAWLRLSPSMRNNRTIFSQGYNTYLAWWKTVNWVTVKSVNLISETPSKAILRVHLKYRMNNRRVYYDRRQVKLAWDEKTNSWLILETRRMK